MSNFEKLSNFTFSEDTTMTFTLKDGVDIRVDNDSWQEDFWSQEGGMMSRLITLAGSGLDFNTAEGKDSRPLLAYLQEATGEDGLTESYMNENYYDFDRVIDGATEMWDYKWGHHTATTTVTAPLACVLHNIEGYTNVLSGFNASVKMDGLTISFTV